MNITEDVKRLSDIQRMIGQISGKSDEDWIDDFCAMVGDYITELFLAKTELAIRREPLPQYAEWQDAFDNLKVVKK